MPGGPTRAAGSLGAHGSPAIDGRLQVSAQSAVTSSSSSVRTGPWYLFLAETRYQTPKISGSRIANGV